MATTLYGRARTALLALLAATAVITGLSAAAPAHADGGLGTPPGVSAADWAPVGVDGDKGAPPQATVATRRAAGAAATAATCPDKACYFYNAGRQEVANTGAVGYMSIAKPAVTYGDHSLGELSVQSSLNGIRQIVEVGWNVDPVVNGDYEPHLFVYHWVNSQESCYNGCGFVVAADTTVKPGAILPVGESKRFAIQFFKSSWWVSYDNQWIGYFPSTLWSDEDVTFTSAGAYQVFGEVASPADQPCTDMGTGVQGSAGAGAKPQPAYFLSWSVFDLEGVSSSSSLLTPKAPDVAAYTIGALNARSFLYGGPGFC
ncbi:neprosin family prolyl endopeptidase [Actinoplanes sp. CA-142083]|uniref:neprosin family prolyl endopeptidase n=1 Tax=Actinoplanes sp. CA-142083 TaxID=3239903 RepID=UPI003D933A94